ncbi:MAG: hypothetical protein UY26_C0003G0187 [Candidatus Jorgensenbacteria bacterium GW2011_GWA1_48_13]|nr:MAG: hypothetical protein UY26_C0003G0187 [Candidatus Jorgensenbacteria bacterium GW2011_GWA1_48_13]
MAGERSREHHDWGVGLGITLDPGREDALRDFNGKTVRCTSDQSQSLGLNSNGIYSSLLGTNYLLLPAVRKINPNLLS